MTETEERITIGKRLRQITSKARIDNEAKALVDILMEEANKGNSRKSFDDLRTIVPNMIANETLWDWLRSEEITVVGQINQQTAAYEYTLMWE